MFVRRRKKKRKELLTQKIGFGHGARDKKCLRNGVEVGGTSKVELFTRSMYSYIHIKKNGRDRGKRLLKEFNGFPQCMKSKVPI